MGLKKEQGQGFNFFQCMESDKHTAPFEKTSAEATTLKGFCFL